MTIHNFTGKKYYEQEIGFVLILFHEFIRFNFSLLGSFYTHTLFHTIRD